MSKNLINKESNLKKLFSIDDELRKLGYNKKIMDQAFNNSAKVYEGVTKSTATTSEKIESIKLFQETTLRDLEKVGDLISKDFMTPKEQQECIKLLEKLGKQPGYDQLGKISNAVAEKGIAGFTNDAKVFLFANLEFHEIYKINCNDQFQLTNSMKTAADLAARLDEKMKIIAPVTSFIAHDLGNGIMAHMEVKNTQYKSGRLNADGSQEIVIVNHSVRVDNLDIATNANGAVVLELDSNPVRFDVKNGKLEAASKDQNISEEEAHNALKVKEGSPLMAKLTELISKAINKFAEIPGLGKVVDKLRLNMAKAKEYPEKESKTEELKHSLEAKGRNRGHSV